MHTSFIIYRWWLPRADAMRSLVAESRWGLEKIRNSEKRTVEYTVAADGVRSRRWWDPRGEGNVWETCVFLVGSGLDNRENQIPAPPFQEKKPPRPAPPRLLAVIFEYTFHFLPVHIPRVHDNIHIYHFFIFWNKTTLFK